MLKKYKTTIFVLILLIISGFVLISKIGLEIKGEDSEKEKNESIEIERSNTTTKISNELSKNNNIDTEKNKPDGYIRKGVNNKNQIETHVKLFIEAFYHNNMDELNRRAGAVLQQGDKVIPELLSIISDQSHDPLLRKMVFELIREIGLSHEHVKLLTDMARNKRENPIIRGEAIWALGFTASADAVEPLMEILGDKKEENRNRKLAASSLGMLNATQAENLLIETLNSKENGSKVRAASAEALGAINNPQNLKILHNSINDQSWEVQISSIKSLPRFKHESSSLLLEKKLIELIQNEKTDVNDALVISTIDSLVLLRSETSVPVFLEILKGKDPFYSALSGKALGDTGDSQSILEISEVLKTADDPFQVRLLEEALNKLNEK